MAKLSEPRSPSRVKRSPADLARYRAKRDFTTTSEPKGRRGRAADALRFVVQKHDARRLHYDLRLELDGVLKSWAVTRGPSLVPGVRRLAVHVEDHPLDYAGWEGVIPKGEYGGGTVIVWDRGEWVPEGDPHEGYAAGRLTFTLSGERLGGRWHLVRTKPRAGKEQWLLLKSADAFARGGDDPDVLEEHTTSVLSGRTNEDLAEGGVLRPDHRARAAVVKRRRTPATDLGGMSGARRGILPPFVEPCLATLVPAAPAGSDWLHEIKLDGYRLQARIEGRTVRLLTRSGLDWTERFASVAEALRHLALPSALIDGELVVEDARGISSFGALQDELAAGRNERFVYHAFDLLYANGRDLRGAGLRDRKAALAEALDDPPADGRIRYCEHIEGDGVAMGRHACRLGLEGIVSKRADRPYRSGRGHDWVKSKCTARQELVIAGYVPSTVSRDSVGSLVFGVQEAGRLVHVGRAGTGYTSATARALRARLEPLRRPDAPFAGRLPPEAIRGGVRWVEPSLVAEVELRGWTGDGQIRHAAYKGLREDKEAESVVREGASPPRRARVSAARGKSAARPALTHPDRVLWPDIGLTKQGLAEYYEAVAERILPEIVDRPLSLVRCPAGVGGECFFQKHAWAGLDGKAVRRVKVDDGEALAIRDLAGLLALVQASVLEIHPWGSRLRSLDRPDRLIVDLDPGPGVGWGAIVAGAHAVRERLDAKGLAAFVKTSGGKGLHVVAPLKPRADWDTVKAFALGLAEAMAADAPDRYVATMAKRARPNRILIDIHRNGRGATAVGAYSTRSRPGAPVSTPLDWSELPLVGGADRFTVANLPARLASLAADPWRDFAKAARTLAEGRL